MCSSRATRPGILTYRVGMLAGVFTISCSLVEWARQARSPIELGVSPGILQCFSDLVDDCDAGVPDLENLVFFRVVNAWPERRDQVTSAHALRRRTCVNAVLFGSGRRHGGNFILSTASSESVQLNLRTWSSQEIFYRVLQNLLSWSDEGGAREIELCPVRHSVAHLRLLADIPSDSDVSDHLADEIVPYHSVAAPPQAAVIQRCLRNGATIQEGKLVDLMLGGSEVHAATVAGLVEQGILRHGAGEFGEHEWALDLSSVRVSSGIVCSEPQLDANQPRDVLHHCSRTKLELVRHLILQGWLVHDGPGLAPYTAEGPKQFPSTILGKSKWYMAALLEAAAILNKGAPQIHHNRPEAYYQCLLDLQILDDLWAIDGSSTTNARYRQLLQGILAPEQPVLEDAQNAADLEALALEDAVEAGALPLLAPPVDAQAVMDASRIIKPAAIAGHPEVQIKYDSCSHSSGHQRAYVTCLNPEHDRCFKYTQVRLHACQRDMCAFLYAWAVMGLTTPTKEQHKQELPWPTDVSLAKAFFGDS